jgi:hypothetical protein
MAHSGEWRMDLDDLERFSQALKDDPALGAEARASAPHIVVARAARRGWHLSLEQAGTFAADDFGVELSDDQLDQVNGGWSAYKEG